ncbi:hypothetical protein SLA2020_431600 [Shorea laevis]
MATIFSFASITPHLNSHHHALIFKPNYCPKKYRLRCNGENPGNNSSSSRESESENALLKIACVVERPIVVETIKDDFERSYFVTGNLTLDAYEERCEFADPAGSFKGLRRFKRNCTNFGSLVEKSNMQLMKWEDFEDKGVGHWRFSCILSFPWKPILSATGYTEYYFDTNLEKYAGMWSTGMGLWRKRIGA